MKGVRKFSIFLLISVFLFCIGVEPKTIEGESDLSIFFSNDRFSGHIGLLGYKPLNGCVAVYR